MYLFCLFYDLSVHGRNTRLCVVFTTIMLCLQTLVYTVSAGFQESSRVCSVTFHQQHCKLRDAVISGVAQLVSDGIDRLGLKSQS